MRLFINTSLLILALIANSCSDLIPNNDLLDTKQISNEISTSLNKSSQDSSEKLGVDKLIHINKNPIIISDGINDLNGNDFTYTFVPKTNYDELSPINQTTGSSIRQYYYPGFYWSKSEVEKHYIWEEDKYMETYGTSQSQWTTLDYDNDGYLDLFGFMTKSSDLPIGSDYPGKLFVRNDFINNPIEDFNDITFLDQTDIYEYGHSLMADVDGDGKLEIFSHDNDHHIRPDGSSIFRGGISMHKIINDTTVEEYKIGRTTLSHDFALGDIDNDGDTDLIYFLLQYSPNAYDLEIPRAIPQIMMNDGSGNFYEVDTFEYFINLDEVQTHTIPGDSKTYKKNWTVIAFDLIDLNNDNILDIVDTHTHNHCVEPTSSAELCENGTVVYWGQGDGYFDLKDKTILPIDYVFDIGGKISQGGGHDHNGNIELFPLGHSFLDINNDGHLDIINAIVMSDPLIDFGGYVSWTIQIIQNNGNGNFVDVTSTHIVGAPKIQDIGQTCEQYGIESLSHFVPYDIDNDGDFDLLPEIVQPPHCMFDYSVFFENDNGIFRFTKI